MTERIKSYIDSEQTLHHLNILNGHIREEHFASSNGWSIGGEGEEGSAVLIDFHFVLPMNKILLGIFIFSQRKARW